MRSIGYAGLAILILATPAAAQTGEATSPPPGPVLVGGAIGITADGHATGVAVAVDAVVDLTRHLAVRFDATGMDRGRYSDAFAGTAELLVRIPGTDRVHPFLHAGGGVYHARFESGPAPFDLGAAGVGPYMRMVVPAGPAVPMGNDPGTIPAFYARRLREMDHVDDRAWASQSFTDPVISLGGGLEIELSRRLILRPDVGALIVVDGGRSHTLARFAAGFGYHF